MKDGALDKVGRALLQLRHDRQQRRVRGERLDLGVCYRQLPS